MEFFLSEFKKELFNLIIAIKQKHKYHFISCVTPLNILLGCSSLNFMIFTISYPVVIWLLKHPEQGKVRKGAENS